MCNYKTALLEGSQAYPACPSDKGGNKIKKSMEGYGKTKVLGIKPAPEQIWPSLMSHAVAQDQTRASAKFLEMGVNNT
jgi:hypothetical protein